MKQPYAFGDDWKAAVDRNGYEWQSYCEARSQVKKYLKTRLLYGKQAAVDEFEQTCQLFQKTSAEKEARVVRLKQLFLQIWENERHELERIVMEEESEAIGHAA